MKRLLSILILLLMACALFVGCDAIGNHYHVAKSQWLTDGTNHYHECIFEGCTKKLNLSPCGGGVATCTQSATCSTCGNNYGNALGHNYSTIWFKDDVNHWQECACGQTTNVTAHSWVAGQVITNADCTTMGKQTYLCACGATKQVDIDTTGHTYTAVVTAPTCTEQGYTTYYCSCGSSYVSDQKAPTNHSYTTVVTKPTCTTHGYTTYTCESCKYSYVCDIQDATNHSWQKGQVTLPTCTQEGFTNYHCPLCGTSKRDDVVDKVDHSYSNGICTACGDVDVNYTPPKDHNHVYTAVVTAPTCTERGKTTYSCHCGNSYFEEIPPLNHIDEDLDIVCDRIGCNGKVAPEADSTIPLATANAIGASLSTTNKYYVVGTIVRYHLENDTVKGIFWIEDEFGVQFLVRMPKNQQGVSHDSWDYRLLIGDTIKLYGCIGKFVTFETPKGYYPTMEGGLLVEVLQKHTCDFTHRVATCTTPAYCLCKKSFGQPLGHTDKNSDNVCDSCQFRLDATVEIITTHFEDIQGTNNFDLLNGRMTFVGDQFTVTAHKGISPIAPIGTDHIRLHSYNTLEICANKDKKIVSLTFVTLENYVDELQAFIKSTGQVCTINGLEVTIHVDELDSITLCNNSQKTVYVTALFVTYVDATNPT